jgi:hypothetical protein
VSNTFLDDVKTYGAPAGVRLRRIRRLDHISFLASVVDKKHGYRTLAEVELQLTWHQGVLEITMRRVVSKRDSWFCNTSTIQLPAQAIAELIQALNTIETVSKDETLP